MKSLSRIIFFFASVCITLPSVQSQTAPLNDTVVHNPSFADDPYAFTPVDVEPKTNDDARTKIIYPEEAKRNHWEGTVFLRFKVMKNGEIGRVLIEKSDRKIFNQPAIDALRKCTYSPAMRGGKAIDVWTSIALQFKLK